MYSCYWEECCMVDMLWEIISIFAKPKYEFSFNGPDHVVDIIGAN